MKNKGFTLIELLAVIVILAIIALIATPIILGVVNDARDSAAERNVELVISNVELAYSTAYMNNNGQIPTLEQVRNNFKMDGATWTSSDGLKVSQTGVTCEVTSTTNLSVKCSTTKNPTGKTTTASMTLAG